MARRRSTRCPRCPPSSSTSADGGATRSRSPAEGSSDQERPRTRITPDRALCPIETSRRSRRATLTRGENSSARPTCQKIRRHRQRHEPRLFHQSSSDGRTVTTTREERCRRPRPITDSNDHPHRHQTPSAPWEAAGSRRPPAGRTPASSRDPPVRTRYRPGELPVLRRSGTLDHSFATKVGRGVPSVLAAPAGRRAGQGRPGGPASGAVHDAGERPDQRKRVPAALWGNGVRGGSARCARRRRGGNLAGAAPPGTQTTCGAGVDDAAPSARGRLRPGMTRLSGLPVGRRRRAGLHRLGGTPPAGRGPCGTVATAVPGGRR
ncbi:hypothetical protein FF36_00593 [Frankia torreyi]|uniref:Uncharacterized protein n=1 Tax=Frankia torreyi TaxID=1856 RepID=A0A0D8BNK1_9ACTN|nr:hypothetical protein FF36_00593 [Frankia torreyi]KQM07173.1 hypothetical protein FF86_100471 [Frankia sp. CpI1-P]